MYDFILELGKYVYISCDNVSSSVEVKSPSGRDIARTRAPGFLVKVQSDTATFAAALKVADTNQRMQYSLFCVLR